MKEIPEKLKERLQFPIPVLSNGLIRQFMEAGLISIDPFDPGRLAPTEYQLCAKRVRFVRFSDENDGAIVDYGSVLIEPRKPYIIQPRESILVSISVEIELPEGVVADFYPSSACIDKRLHLTAGRLHPKYSHAIMMGLHNTGEEQAILDLDFQIARVTFCWLGFDNMPDYSQHAEPAAYIKEIERIRMREQEITVEIERLKKEKEELSKESKR